jgi:hypothetical protein
MVIDVLINMKLCLKIFIVFDKISYTFDSIFLFFYKLSTKIKIESEGERFSKFVFISTAVFFRFSLKNQI